MKKRLLSLLSVLTMLATLLPAGMLTASAAEPIKIACVGDSITEGAMATSKAFSYPSQLQNLLGSGYNVGNFGVGSRCLLKKGDLPYTDNAAYINSQNFQPDYVIIMLGANDSKTENWNPYKGEFATDMKDLINSYRALDSHPVVIIATTPAMYLTGKEMIPNEIVPLEKQVAAEMGCPLIDIHTLTQGMLPYYYDGVHPNDTGYALLAQMFYDGLQDIFNARIKGFAANGADGVIDDEAGTVSLTLPHGTDLTAVKPTVTLADGAKINKTGVQNFTNPVTYTVTSPDGKQTKTYTVTVKTADATASAAATLDGLTLNGAIGVVDNETDAVSVTLPAATDITALEPALILPAGAAYAPTGPQDFTKPVTYTVTAADGTTKRDYTVTVNLLDRVKIACVGDSMTAAGIYPDCLQVSLGDGYEIGRFGMNSTTVQKDGLKENGANPNSGAYMNQNIYRQSLNFQPDIVLLMLGANDSKQGEGQEQSGHKLVTNWKEDSPERYEADLIELVSSYLALDSHPTVIIATSPSGYTTAGNWAARPEIVNSQIAPLQRKVAADLGCPLVDFNAYTQGKENELIGGDGLHPNTYGYRQLAGLYYMAIQDAQASIRSFSVNGEPGLVSQIDKTVYVTVPDGTDFTALNPTVTLADGAVSDKTGSQNFGQPVTYSVTSANGHTSTYTVAVTSPSGITVAKIEMQMLPEKTTYQLGERLDTTGASISAVYTDGSRETIAVTEDMVSGYDWLTLGKQTLTVAYGGKTTQFTVQVKPYGVLASFSTREGKARVLNNGSNLLYADWKWADQQQVDLSGYDLADLSLELDIAFGSDQGNVIPADMWWQLTIKLRSADKENVEGDPEIATGNREHNYGWNLKPTDFADPGAIHVSIPLNTAADTKKGVMDWSQVGRIILQCYMHDQYKTNSIDHYMDIQNVYIVDNTQKPVTPDTAALQAAIDQVEDVDAGSYSRESAAAFHRALDLARAYLTNPYASQGDIDQAIAELQAAIDALASAYTLGDVDDNGAVTAADALLALQASTGKITLTDPQTQAADVDGTVGVTASDALLILQYATGRIDAFPSTGE